MVGLRKIIKVRAEIKEIEGKKCKDSVKQAVDSLGKKEHWQTLSQINEKMRWKDSNLKS